MLSGASILQGYLLTEHLGHSARVSRAPHRARSVSGWRSSRSCCSIRSASSPTESGVAPSTSSAYHSSAWVSGWRRSRRRSRSCWPIGSIFAVGMAATAGTMATLTSDYPREDSRGLMIGITSIFNTLGTIFVAGVHRAHTVALLMEQRLRRRHGRQGDVPVRRGHVFRYRCRRARSGWRRARRSRAPSDRRRANSSRAVSSRRQQSAHRARLCMLVRGAFGRRNQGPVLRPVGDSGRLPSRVSIRARRWRASAS